MVHSASWPSKLSKMILYCTGTSANVQQKKRGLKKQQNLLNCIVSKTFQFWNIFCALCRAHQFAPIVLAPAFASLYARYVCGDACISVSMECIRHVENTSQEPSCTSASIDVLFSHVQPMCTPIPSKPGVRLEQALLMKLLTKRCKHKLILNYPKFTCMDCKAQLVSRSWSLHSFVEHLSFLSLLSSIMDLVWLYEMASKPACVSMPTSVSISASLHFIKFWSSTKEISIEALSKWHTYVYRATWSSRCSLLWQLFCTSWTCTQFADVQN